jgi:hypothetical protein
VLSREKIKTPRSLWTCSVREPEAQLRLTGQVANLNRVNVPFKFTACCQSQGTEVKVQAVVQWFYFLSASRW